MQSYAYFVIIIFFLLCDAEVVVKLAEAFYSNSRADSCGCLFQLLQSLTAFPSFSYM